MRDMCFDFLFADESSRRLQPNAIRTVFGCSVLFLTLLFLPTTTNAQDTAGTPTEEIVVNLAAGRVVIAVVKDAILIGTVENPIEPQTHPPIPVSLSSERAGVILGAVQWTSPSLQRDLARLDVELPHLHSKLGVGESAPHLADSKGGDEAADVEAIGQGLLERLNDLVSGLHGKLDLAPNTAIAQLIVADYLANYGAEVWQVSYTLKQSQQRGDYWATSVLRPTYLQFWPPEKGQPKTLVEFDYPADNAPASLLSLIQGNDPRIVKIKESDPKMGEVSDHFLKGESNKILPADAIQFLRAVLTSIAGPNTRQTMAEILPESGLKWILAPPDEPKGSEKQQQRPPGAPTLVKPPSLQ